MNIDLIMRAIYLLPVLLLVITCSACKAQEESDLPPIEEFIDGTEGSGVGVLEVPTEATTETTTEISRQEPILDTTEQPEEQITEAPQYLCPEACTCSVESGENYTFTIDCSDKQLTELPTIGLDEKTTILNLQNNQLTIIPKPISALKNLKVLNLNNNSLADFEAGSISELPSLKTLILSNNRFLEYPQELKNGFDLIHLEELDLSHNDIRSTISVENFANFKSLRKLTLPTSEPTFVEVLCNSYKQHLETVCVGSCETWKSDCPEKPQFIQTDFLEAVLPAVLTDNTTVESDSTKSTDILENLNTTLDTINIETSTTSENDVTASPENNDESTSKLNNDVATPTNAPDDVGFQRNFKNSLLTDNEITELTAIADPGEIPKEGAAISNTTRGGVDKSVIGLVVAGMVIIVAGIVIQKNWSSIKAKFSSGQRPQPTTLEQNSHHAPEEEPLQNKNKSPV